MTQLLRFLIINFAGGFVLGMGTGLVWLQIHHGSELLVDEPIAAGLILWSFAAPFAAGAIGTGLAFLPYG